MVGVVRGGRGSVKVFSQLLPEGRRRWEDNIKMDLQEVGCGGMD
jgi:hypothetical protein